MTRIKICGLSEIEHTVVACEAGADFIGFIFATSRRQVSPDKTESIIKAVHTKYPSIKTVGVFANHSIEEVNRIAQQCGLDWIQLSGGESWDFCRAMALPFIKVIHVLNKMTADEILSEIQKGYEMNFKQRFIILLDTKTEGVYGGSGQTFGWEVAREVTSKFSVMVAGGLTPDNVGELIKEVNPWGVDVSSGVETGGRKDEIKIRGFIDNVRQVRRMQGATG